jgi:hypothetical protein
MLTDQELITEFIQHSLSTKQILLSNSVLRGETVFDTNQLTAKNEGIILKINLTSSTPEFFLKINSSHWLLMNEALASYNFILSGKIDNFGFYSCQYYQIPQGYQVMCTKSLIIWRMWWKYKKYSQGRAIPLKLLIRNRNSWYPVRDLIVSQGFLYIKTLGQEFAFSQDDWITWLKATS